MIHSDYVPCFEYRSVARSTLPGLSEYKLHRELNNPWVAGIQAVVPADIGQDLPKRRGSPRTRRHRGVKVIRQVEEVCPHLNGFSFLNRKCAGKGHVELEHPGTSDVIQSEVSVGAQRGKAEGGGIDPIRNALIAWVDLIWAE